MASLSISEHSIIKQNNYFVCLKLEYSQKEIDPSTGIYSDAYSTSIITKDIDGKINIFIDPNVEQFENDLKKHGQLNKNYKLGKFNTINIVGFNPDNENIINKKYYIDYAFVILNDKTVKDFKPYNENIFINKIGYNGVYTTDISKLSGEYSDFFNPFYIWSKKTSSKPEDFVLLNKKLFDIKNKDLIDPVKNDKYTLIINDTIIANKLDALDKSKTFVSSASDQKIIVYKEDKKNWIWLIIIIVVIIVAIIISIVVGIVVYKKNKRRKLEAQKMNSLFRNI